MPSSIFSRLKHPSFDLEYPLFLILFPRYLLGIHSTVKVRWVNAYSPGPYTKLLSYSLRALNTEFDIYPSLPTCFLDRFQICLYFLVLSACVGLLLPQT